MAATGAYDRCPLCRAVLWNAALLNLDERQCPRCGAELWVVLFSRGPAYFIRRPGENKHEFLHELFAAIAGPDSGLKPSDIEAAIKGMDSLDMTEFIAELEGTLPSDNY